MRVIAKIGAPPGALLRGQSIPSERIPASELVVIPDTGHMSFVEEQARYLDAVRDFLHRATG